MSVTELDLELLRRFDGPAPRYTSYPTALQFGATMDEGIVTTAYMECFRTCIPLPHHEELKAMHMGWTRHDYDDIPGTYVFDGQHAHGAYELNKLLYSFCEQENREAFDRDPGAYCDRFGLDAVAKRLVLGREFLAMLRAGANIYYLAKMAIPRGTSVQDAGAAFQGITTQQFQANLLAKGAGLVDRLKARGGYWVG